MYETYMTHLKNCNVIFKAFLNPSNALRNI